MLSKEIDSDCWSGPNLIMAFQPIIDFSTREVFGYEALVRGAGGEGAGEVLSHVTPANRVAFEMACHMAAIETARRLHINPNHYLSINFLPSALSSVDNTVGHTLSAAAIANIGAQQLIVEVTEAEPVEDPIKISRLFADYRRRGLKTAIDDFGVGYAGLGLLADFQPDFIKIAMPLVRDVDESPARAAITRAILQAARDLSIDVIAEGVESQREVGALRALGVNLFQGFLFARPSADVLIPRADIRFSEPPPTALPLARSVALVRSGAGAKTGSVANKQTASPLRQ